MRTALIRSPVITTDHFVDVTKMVGDTNRLMIRVLQSRCSETPVAETALR